MTRIVWISCVGEKGGAEVTMLNTFRVLDRQRYRPGVIQLRPGPLEHELRGIDSDVWVLRRHRMREWHRVLQAVIQIRNLILREGIALIHSNGFRAHLYGGLAARWTGIPEVWTNHAVEQDNFLTRLICAVPTHQIIANCTRTGDYFKSRRLPTQTIWPGVHVGRLEQGTARAVLAGRYQLPPTARWISMGARLQRFKGHRYFLRTLATLPAESQAHGVVIGGSLFGLEQEYLAELKREASALGLDGRVTFTGFIPDEDVAGLLKESELVIHPALDEDFGLTVAEAQALGVPVLAFAAVGPAVILEHDRTGWLVPIGDQSGLDAALKHALADPQRLRTFGSAGRQRVRERFTIEVHTRQTEAVYERVLDAHQALQERGPGKTGGPTNHANPHE